MAYKSFVDFFRVIRREISAITLLFWKDLVHLTSQWKDLQHIEIINSISMVWLTTGGKRQGRKGSHSISLGPRFG